MGHSNQFGLLSRTPPWRRELRIAMSCLLFGGIAGALCVSGVALRPSDRAAMEFAEAPPAIASQEAASQEVGSGSISSADARAASSENHSGTAARPQASADVSVRKPSETSAPDVAPESAIAPKPRTVRIRKAVDSPAIARLPLAVANSTPPRKKVQKTVRTASSRRDDIENDSFWRGERTDDWSTRPAAPASADVQGARPEKVVTRRGARESIVDPSPPKTARNASSRRDDARNDFFWRDDRQDDWRARPAVNDGRAGADRAYAREATSSYRAFWDWSR